MAPRGESNRGADERACLQEDEALDFIAGRLSGPAAAGVESHADRCSACRHFVSLLARAGATARSTSGLARSATGTDDLAEPHAAASLAPGTQIGRFRLERPIGVGGMGVVYRAIDADLGREVAIKLVRVMDPTVDPAAARERLLAEAQHIARLNSPFVVTVYEAGWFGDDVYVALELVEGGTLTDWLSSARRRWRDIVDLFVMAGRGLAAAHELGIVHRDFKLDNVLVTERGVAKVTDFGLAERVAVSGGATVEAGEGRGGERRVAGTPGYLAPELLRGAAATAASDQYAFAVGLHRALGGGLDGDHGAPHRVSRRVARAIRRGMDPSPARRHPSMAAFLTALDRPRSMTAAVAIAGAMTAALIVAIVHDRSSHREADDPCAAVADLADAVWSPPRRAAVRARLVKSSSAEAPGTAAFIERTLGDYAHEWSSARRAVCQGSSEAGGEAPALDPRAACLDRALHVLDRVVHRMVAPSGSDASTSANALTALPIVDDCRDGAVLLAEVPAPRALIGRVREVERLLSDVEIVLRTGEYAVARQRATEALAAAREIGHPPLLAWALLLMANADAKLGRFGEETIDLLYQALWQSEAGGSDAMAARVWPAIVSLQSTRRGRGPDAAPKLIERAMQHGKAALQRLEARSGRAQPEMELRHARSAAAALRALGRLDEAAASAGRAIEISRSLGGRFLLETVQAEHLLAMIEERRGRLGDAEVHYRAAMALGAELLGPDNAELTMPNAALADVLRRNGRAAEALLLVDRALALMSRGGSPRDPGHLVRLRARVLEALGRRDEALAELERARRLRLEEFGPSSYPVADSEVELGEMHRRQGRLGEAIRAVERAIAIVDRLPERPTADIAWYLTLEAEYVLEAGHPRRAVRVAERALAEGRSVELSPDRRGIAELALARALAALGRAGPRVRQLARFALTELERVGDYESAHRVVQARALLDPPEAEAKARRGRSAARRAHRGLRHR